MCGQPGLRSRVAQLAMSRATLAFAVTTARRRRRRGRVATVGDRRRLRSRVARGLRHAVGLGQRRLRCQARNQRRCQLVCPRACFNRRPSSGWEALATCARLLSRQAEVGSEAKSSGPPNAVVRFFFARRQRRAPAKSLVPPSPARPPTSSVAKTKVHSTSPSSSLESLLADGGCRLGLRCCLLLLLCRLLRLARVGGEVGRSFDPLAEDGTEGARPSLL